MQKALLCGSVGTHATADTLIPAAHCTLEQWVCVGYMHTSSSDVSQMPSTFAGAPRIASFSRVVRHLNSDRRNGLRSVLVSIGPTRSRGQMRTTGLATTRLSARGPQTRESVERASQSPRTKTVTTGPHGVQEGS
jgi:hypothetical protein